MDIKYKLYPYPVLTDFSDDYIESTFESLVDVSKEGYNIKFDFIAETDNIQINELINVGKAEFVFHLECAQSGFRKVVRFQENEFSYLVSEKNLNGKLQICSFIIATENIHKYTNNSLNDDYKGFVFEIEQGCVMAVGKQTNVDIEKEINDFINTPSIFSIVKNADETVTNMLVDMHRDRITIKLHENDYYNYKSIRSNVTYQPLLNSLIIIPALIYILGEIKNMKFEDLRDLEDLRWYRALKKALRKFNCDINSNGLSTIDIFEIAQKLINVPITESLSALAIGYREEEDE